MYIEFAIDIAGVGLDRVQREEKPFSDFLNGPLVFDCVPLE